MPKYLWKAKARSGKNVIKRVEAASLVESKQQLLNAGYTELEAQTDEYGPAVEDMFSLNDCDEMELTPEQEAECLQMGSSSVLGIVLRSIWTNWKPLLIGAAVLGAGLYFRNRWLIGGGALLMFVFPFFFVVIQVPMVYFSRLNKAKVWGRWDEVQSCVDSLKKFSWNPLNVPINELARNEGVVLAAKGRLAEGLAKFAPYAKKLPEWLFTSNCVTIYEEARDFEKGLEYSKKALDLAPDNATLALDHAIRLVQRFSFPDECEEMVQQLDVSLLPPLAKPYLTFCYGLIAWRRGNSSEAREKFSEALEGFRKMLHMDLTEGIYLITKAHLCAAERALGNDAAADKLWTEVEKFLRVHKEQELIDACSAQLVA